MSDIYAIELAGEISSDELKLRRELISKIVHSKSFHTAQVLQNLLLYVAEKGLSKDHDGALKEYSIGVNALGRRQDFDPKVDPVVRVQMHRLRQRLKAYYAAEGAADPLVLEIPKGSYLPAFTSPSPTEPVESIEACDIAALGPDDSPLAVSVPDDHNSWLNRRPDKSMLVVAGAFVLGALMALLWSRIEQKHASASQGANLHDDSVQKFWMEFLGKDTAPIIAYPDAVFLLDESNDLFRFRQGATDQRGTLVNPDVVLRYSSNPDIASKAGPLYYETGYTGTGELQAVAALSSLFARMGRTPTIKNSRDITTADLAQHDVILLGSPFQNRAVAQLPAEGNFIFDNPDPHRELWRGRILDLHPTANEDSKYQTTRDPETGALKSDYGLITIVNGIAPNVRIAILGGLDTTGTQGVTDFAVSPGGVSGMEAAMNSFVDNQSKGFQALVKVNLEMGYQVLDFRMVALNEIKMSGSRQSNK